MHARMGVVVHHPEALLDQMTLQRRVLAKVRDELFQHVGIEDARPARSWSPDIRRAPIAAP